MLKKLRKIALTLVFIFSANCFILNVEAVENKEAKIDLSANSIFISDKEYTFEDISSDIIELTSIIKHETEIPEKVLLNVKNIQQLPELPAGCEITSTTIVLNYLGFKCNKMELLNYMPIMKEPDKNGRWTSPNESFIGDPEKTCYGTYAPVIKKTIELYFKENDTKNYSVYNLTGSSVDELYAQVANGKPVIVWATVSMKESRIGHSWYLQDGTKYTWTAGEHCLVLIGYDKSKKTVTFSDPYDERGTVTYNSDLFEMRYKELGKQAVVVKENK